MNNMEGCEMDMMMGWPMVLAVLVLLAVLALAIVGLVSLVRRRESPPRSGAQNAHDVLQHRFAAGEIDEDEYQRRRDLIQD